MTRQTTKVKKNDIVKTPTTKTSTSNAKSSKSLAKSKIGRKNVDEQGVDMVPGQTPNKAINNRKAIKKKIHALDAYIIFCFVCIIIYTVVHTIIFYKLGIEASILDALFYGVFGGEVLLCALLKKLKLKQEFQLKLNSNQTNDTELAEDRYNE